MTDQDGANDCQTLARTARAAIMGFALIARVTAAHAQSSIASSARADVAGQRRSAAPGQYFNRTTNVM
jgi:hypothetical protein